MDYEKVFEENIGMSSSDVEEIQDNILDFVEEFVENGNNTDRYKAMIIVSNMLCKAKGKDRRALLAVLSSLVTITMSVEGYSVTDLKDEEMENRCIQIMNFLSETMGLQVW